MLPRRGWRKMGLIVGIFRGNTAWRIVLVGGVMRAARTWGGLALLLASAVAQAAPADGALPDLAVSAKDLGDERKYFVLHRPGVSVARAEADLTFCWRFLARGAQRTAPDFVAWRSGDAARKGIVANGPYGLVGDMIGAIVAGPIERSLRQSRIFRCMVPRGYARYRTSETVWKQLNEGDAAQAIRLQARIAAGAVPPTPRVIR